MSRPADGAPRRSTGPSFGPLRAAAKWVRDAARWNRHQRVCFSQEGEDLVLERFFGNRRDGFFVDVGAHHPHRFSNTYLFYRRGWRGINIDAMPGSMAPFRRHRPRDINLEIPVLRERGLMRFHQFRDPALNGFSTELSRQRVDVHGCELLGVVELEGRPLGDILAESMPADVREIDFLSVDVEGLDLEVLQSNDWSRFRPVLVLVELIGSSMATVDADPVYRFLRGEGYDIYAKTAQTVLFIRRDTQRDPDA